MKLLSINVALPEVIRVDERPVSTAIYKKPVAGPVQVERLNLAGDRQADLSVHGGAHKAAYVYSIENVQYWQKVLQRNDLGPGSFGENLTVEDLLETEVAIGDELEIGSARFQVTQPRIPCFKLAHALGLPAFPKMFLESGRTGFYLRVLKEGVITAGDPVVHLPNRAAPRVTISEFARVVHTREASEDQLRRIRSLQALPAPWHSWLERKVVKSRGRK